MSASHRVECFHSQSSSMKRRLKPTEQIRLEKIDAFNS
jgi:hypothetical protein